MRASSNLSLLVLSGGVALFVACGSTGKASTDETPTPSPVTTVTAAPTSTSTVKPAPPADAPSVSRPGDRFHEIHGVVHMHSPYSHDACDGQGLTAGVPNASCLADLRAAPCKDGLDFIALTDHPAHMNEYEPTQNVLYDAAAGDVLVKDATGAVIGTR